MRVIREDWLHSLERVQPALSVAESVEQATTFVFKGGYVHAFNKKLYCASPLKCPVEGAVHSKPLLQFLKKLTVEEITLSGEDSHLVGRFGKKERDCFRIALQETITLPIDDVDEPKDWKPLHESFSDALAIVQETAGKDRERMYLSTCINVQRNFLESYDGKQATRYFLPTGVTAPCLVEKEVLKAVVASGVEEIGETKRWLHFRGPGIRMACRREVDDYPKIKHVYEGEGELITLPASLAEVAELCEIASGEEKDNNVVLVEVRAGEMTLHGKGVSCDTTVTRACEYKGPAVKFYLSPALLKSLGERGSEVFICPGENGHKLLIDGDHWVWATASVPVED